MHQEAQVDVEFRKKFLSYFSSKKTKKIIKLLEKHPELATLRLYKERTILHFAIIHNLSTVVEYLLKNHPELLSVNDRLNRNIFHYVVEYGEDDQIAHIVINHPDAIHLKHQKDNKQRTPLQLAAISGKAGILDLFKAEVFPNLAHHRVDSANIASLTQDFANLNLFKTGKNTTQRARSRSLLGENELAVKQIQATNDELEELSSTLESTLLKAGFEIHDEAQGPLQVNLVWNLCSGFNPVTPTPEELEAQIPSLRTRQFNKMYIVHVLHGLLTEKNNIEILDEIKNLWPEFDINQKLTAIFIIKELLFWDIHHQLLHKDSHAKTKLKPLLQIIANEFSPIGNTIVMLINKMLKAKGNALKNNLFNNRDRAGDELIQNLGSFQGLLLETIMIKKKKKQKPNIKRIADELKTMTLDFYHLVNIREYYNAAWGKEGGISAPHINYYIRNSNNLFNYLQWFVLQADTVENCAARLSLLINIASHLCEEHDGIGADFASIVTIVGVLSGASIGRLKPCIGLLSEDDKLRLQDLKNLVSPIFGNQTIRSVANATRHGIFPPSIFQAEVTFAYESGCDKHEMIGKVFSKILKLKRSLQVKPIQYKTDVLALINSNEYELTWLQAHYLTGKFQPIILDVMTLEELIEMIQYMIQIEFFPNVTYMKNIYEPHDLVETVLKKMKECLSLKAADGEDITDLTINARKAACDLLALSNRKFDQNTSISLIEENLPEQSLKRISKKRSVSVDTADMVNPPTYVVRRSPEALRRNNTVKFKTPQSRRKYQP